MHDGRADQRDLWMWTMALTAQQIAELTGGDLRGDGDAAITAVQVIARASADDLVFAGDARHVAMLAHTPARVALIKRDRPLPDACDITTIAVDDVDLAVGRVLEQFAPAPSLPDAGVHPSSVIDPSATIGQQVRIGPLCHVGPGATVGNGCVLHGSVTLMAGARIGQGVVLWPGVVIADRCTIGDGSIIQPGAVIGGDGFGYRPMPDGQGIYKIPHIGHVEIGRLVEIGANTTIDRGKFDATVIGDACKIDNLCQIGHNCRFGRGVIIAGHTAIGGSIEIGDGVVVGGGVDLRDHITIGPGATVAGGAQVIHDVPPGETWAGSPAKEYHTAGRELSAIRHLPDLMKKVKKQLKVMEE